MRELSSDAAYRPWLSAKQQADIGCSEVDGLDKQVADLQAHLDEARKCAEAARQRHEHALSRRGRVLSLSAELRSRLRFHTGLPRDVAAAIHGGVGRARRRAACVCKAWRESIDLAKSKGLFRLRVLSMAW